MLQKAGELVERAQQTSEKQRHALDEIKDLLVKKEVLAHKDKVCWKPSRCLQMPATACLHLHAMQQKIQLIKWALQQLRSGKAVDVDDAMQDVKLRNAFSLCHVLRMHAPETPYSTIILEVSCTSAHSVISSLRLTQAGNPQN